MQSVLLILYLHFGLLALSFICYIFDFYKMWNIIKNFIIDKKKYFCFFESKMNIFYISLRFRGFRTFWYILAEMDVCVCVFGYKILSTIREHGSTDLNNSKTKMLISCA